VDERGHGLQMTWHPDQGLIIVSIWLEDRCVGTAHLPVTEAARAGGFLLAVLNDWLGQHPEIAPGPTAAQATTD
jgi:hypothetical protein